MSDREIASHIRQLADEIERRDNSIKGPPRRKTKQRLFSKEAPVVVSALRSYSEILQKELLTLEEVLSTRQDIEK
jgi:hypothetical protein